jgi:RNA polymerase sigma-70 factor (ECF subfamily)
MAGGHRPRGSRVLTDDVVAGARRGDREAIADVYRALAPAVIGYLRGGGASDPENAAGDVFVGVVRGLPNFAGGADALRTWVFTIAHRRLVDDRRRRRRRPEAPLGDNVVRFTGGDDYEAVLESVSAAPLRHALGSLTSEQRAVVLLRVVGELSLAETAKVVGKPVAAVKMLQRRGLASLARQVPEPTVDPGVTSTPALRLLRR